jgi:cell wall-associated NlpC family hydrolase
MIRGSGDLHAADFCGWAAMPDSQGTAAIAEAQTSADPRRLAVIEEVVGWLRTPYHHMARVKGVGADCLTLLAEVYEKAGVIPHVDVPFYPPDWNLHRDAERYLEGIMRYAHEVPVGNDADPPKPGDIAVFKFGRCFAHGAIVLHWPRLIHAWHNAGVVYADASQGQLTGRPMRIFDPFSATI